MWIPIETISDAGFLGSTLQSWGGVHERCIDFLGRWADEAVALGWTTLDLFGVHPEAGAIRPDFCGALVLSDAPITAITANQIAFLNTAFYRDTPGKPAGAVPLIVCSVSVTHAR